MLPRSPKLLQKWPQKLKINTKIGLKVGPKASIFPNSLLKNAGKIGGKTDKIVVPKSLSRNTVTISKTDKTKVPKSLSRTTD